MWSYRVICTRHLVTFGKSLKLSANNTLRELKYILIKASCTRGIFTFYVIYVSEYFTTPCKRYHITISAFWYLSYVISMTVKRNMWWNKSVFQRAAVFMLAVTIWKLSSMEINLNGIDRSLVCYLWIYIAIYIYIIYMYTYLKCRLKHGGHCASASMC